MDISNWVTHRALRSPNKVAIRFEAGDWTNRQFEDRVGRLAGALVDELDIRIGDRVAYLGLNSPDLLALFFACARVGACIVPLNWRLAPAEHEYQIDTAAPRAIFVEASYVDHLTRVRCRIEGIRHLVIGGDHDRPPHWLDYGAVIAAASPLPANSRHDLMASPCEIKFTSGTTGRPKGAVRTQEGVFYNAVNAGRLFALTADDHVLAVLPMFHAGGMHIQTTPAVYWGSTITIHRRFEPGACLAEIAAGRPTLLLGVPALSAAITSHPLFPSTDVSSLRCFCGGSQMVPDAVIDPWVRRGVPFIQVYGSTEAGPVAIGSSVADDTCKDNSAGKPALHMEVRLVDDSGNDVEDGETGEIWVRGRSVLKEYWKNPEATKDSLSEDGWYKTGDTAYRDGDGDYHIRGRKKDMIISGGENIYPAELDNVLAECADIEEFAVVGRPDARWGEVPVVCLVVKAGRSLTKEQVIGSFQNRLARFKHPHDVVFLEGPLPRSAVGKIKGFELREIARRAGPAEP